MRFATYRKVIFFLLLALVVVFAVSRLEVKFREDQTAQAAQPDPSSGSAEQQEAVLPSEADFNQAAETGILILKVDETTGHFIVEDKRNGNVWRSYPNPEDFENETIGGIWKTHLVSPLMFQYTDFSVYNTQPRESNFRTLGGTIKDITEIDGGVQWTYDMPALGFSVPVQIRIQDDYLETKIIDKGIKEEQYSLIWLRLFPFMAAEHSADREGYLFVPDGSGTLIAYDDHRLNTNLGYQESVYGKDPSFMSRLGFSSRYPAQMPVFGIHSGDKGLLAVIEDGAEYSDIFAAPSGMLSSYNWITAQQTYRAPFEQITNRSKGTSFTTYNKDERFGTDRAVRYYLLDKGKSDYVGMAERYRTYLMEEKGLRRLTDIGSDLPLHITLLGGDSEDGMLGSRYIKATTTEEAADILSDLRRRGIEQMSVTYLGWQKGGYAEYGGYFDVDTELGGEQGMKTFIEHAHSMDIPVMLGVNYEFNNTGNGGFREQYHAIRNMAGTMQEARIRGGEVYMASKQFILEALQKELGSYAKLGADGLLLMETGSRLESDYNTRIGVTRTDSISIQQELFDLVRSELGEAWVESPNFYMLGSVTHVNALPDDYSYDLFSQEAVPFAQIALHGLIPYTSGFENDRQQFSHDFLRDIEFGALPSFIFTASAAEKLTEAHGLQLKSSHYESWAETAALEYSRYNEALSEVQDQFIVGHQELAEGVKATTYENGTMIIVNYTEAPFVYKGHEIAGQSYSLVKEGGA
ncbi:DUF5696 domain-containing protein [Neobacillus mesonae]|nr:DUF5696 domain-containing protein [Neobacillus mesonae]